MVVEIRNFFGFFETNSERVLASHFWCISSILTWYHIWVGLQIWDLKNLDVLIRKIKTKKFSRPIFLISCKFVVFPYFQMAIVSKAPTHFWAWQFTCVAAKLRSILPFLTFFLRGAWVLLEAPQVYENVLNLSGLHCLVQVSYPTLFDITQWKVIWSLVTSWNLIFLAE